MIVDLERTSKELLITQKLQEMLVILRAASNKINRFATRGTILDILAAIKEPALILFRPEVV